MEKPNDIQLQNRLMAAIIKGELKKVENIINSLELSPTELWPNGYKFLCIATEYNQDEIIELILKTNAPVNSVTEKYLNSPLNSAVKLNKVETVKLLIQKGAEIDKQNIYRRNSFDIAIENGNLEILELLVDHISDTNISDESYIKLLADLLKTSNHKLMEKVLTKCLHIDINHAMAAVNFLCIAVQKNYYSIVESLLNRHVDINFINYSRFGSQTALYIACRIGDYKMVDMLLQNGASMDIKYEFFYSNSPKNIDQYNLYPIHIAIVYGYTDIVKKLLDYGDNSNKKYVTPFGTEYTALYLACEYHRQEIVELLITRGADINFQDHRGYKSIFAAVPPRKYDNTMKGNCKIFKYLIGNKNLVLDFINIKAILISAAQKLQVDILVLTIEYCNNLEASIRNKIYNDLIKDRSPNLLLHIVTQHNKFSFNSEDFIKFFDVLIKYGVDINCRDQNGRTLLHKAFWYRRKQSIELLLRFGGNLNLMCDGGYTPIDYMLERKLFEAVYKDGYYNVDNFNKDLEDIVDFVSQYVVKIKFLRLDGNKCGYDQLINRSEKTFKYREIYEEEIEEMKHRVIDNGVTFYDFVTADLYKTVVFLENKVIFETLESGNFGSMFPEYENVIRGCFYKGVVRKKLLDEAHKLTIFNMIDNLPYPCMRNIMDCFSNSDLKDVISEYEFLMMPKLSGG
ncbi:transient receptor potential cation channel subfamily A member 1-like [Microplitis mediator]|uniref:transient receptor potential cation channel subfamily A member 1-like n=1 Tax=Microplitis mediator TaxID=375433 RepID=UPI0025556547|nr:transient receptor potential cation channel subfamily A member 1-like [Microplitis mediator]